MTSGFRVRRANRRGPTRHSGPRSLACIQSRVFSRVGVGWDENHGNQVMCVCVAAQVARSGSGTNINSTHAREYSAL